MPPVAPMLAKPAAAIPLGHFYEHYGFERTGEVRFDEVMLRLKLR